MQSASMYLEQQKHLPKSCLCTGECSIQTFNLVQVSSDALGTSIRLLHSLISPLFLLSLSEVLYNHLQ